MMSMLMIWYCHLTWQLWENLVRFEVEPGGSIELHQNLLVLGMKEEERKAGEDAPDLVLEPRSPVGSPWLFFSDPGASFPRFLHQHKHRSTTTQLNLGRTIVLLMIIYLVTLPTRTPISFPSLLTATTLEPSFKALTYMSFSEEVLARVMPKDLETFSDPNCKNGYMAPERGFIREETVVEEFDHTWNHGLVHELKLDPPLAPLTVRIHLQLNLKIGIHIDPSVSKWIPDKVCIVWIECNW